MSVIRSSSVKQSKVREEWSDVFDFVESELLVDFKTFMDCDLEKPVRGITYTDKNQVYIYLPTHEVIEDILSTITHEVAGHYAVGKDLGNIEGEDYYQEDEHKMIKMMVWTNYIITDNDKEINIFP